MAVYTELGPDGLTELTNVDDGIVAKRSEMLAAAGHATRRHGPAVAEAQLEARAMRQLDPITRTTTDWEKGTRHRANRHATAFTSRAALVFAEAVVWNSAERAAAFANADRKPVGAQEWKSVWINVPARRVFGDDFREHVHGRTRVGSVANPQGTQPTVFGDDALVKVLYRREPAGHDWLPYTCYIEP